MNTGFYEIGRVIGTARCGFSVTKHNCERGSATHRQGDPGEEIAFFEEGPDAEIKARAFLTSLSDDNGGAGK